jgi:hypothetical protein
MITKKCLAYVILATTDWEKKVKVEFTHIPIDEDFPEDGIQQTLWEAITNKLTGTSTPIKRVEIKDIYVRVGPKE